MDSEIEYTWTTESKVFRINTVIIPPSDVESYLAKIKSNFNKNPIIQVPQNLYQRNLITEKVEKFPSLPYENEYYFPVR